MIRDTYAVLFYTKNSKSRNNGEYNESPIYCRITIRGKRVEFSTKRYVNPEYWNSENSLVEIPNDSKASKAINNCLEIIDKKLYNLQAELLEKHEVVTSLMLKNAYLGIDENSKSLLEAFEYHNKRMEELVNIEYEPNTYKGYKTSLKHVKEFLKVGKKIGDIPLKKLNYTFITDFEMFLRTDKGLSNNSALKYITHLSKVTNLSIKNGWLTTDPFVHFEGKITPTDRGYLNAEELATLENKEFTIARIDEVRDCFVFSCYTGLAYAEIMKLSEDNMVTGIDGNKWINIRRKKTRKHQISQQIPLLPKALEIIEKYQDHPLRVKENRLLPVKSNQRMNSYLKEIADLCGFGSNINLTTHLARHTFSTTVTLANGVGIETVSKLLGHTQLRTTQIYARVVESKLSEDMNELKEKLADKEKDKREAI